jgi:PAS domain S-box-containing protein
MARKPTYEELEEKVRALEKEAEERYRSLVSELNDGIFVTDDKGDMTFANRALAEMHGYENPEDFIGKNFLELVSHEERDRIVDRFNRAVRSGEFTGDIFDVSAIRKDGGTIAIQLKATPIKKGGIISINRGKGAPDTNSVPYFF